MDSDSDEDNENYEDKSLLKRKEFTEPKRNLHHEDNKIGSVLWKNYVAYYRYTGGIAILLYTTIIFAVCQMALGYSEKLLSSW